LPRFYCPASACHSHGACEVAARVSISILQRNRRAVITLIDNCFLFFHFAIICKSFHSRVKFDFRALLASVSRWFFFWLHKSVSSPIFILLWGAGCVKRGVNLSEFCWQLALERAKTRKRLIDWELGFFSIYRFSSRFGLFFTGLLVILRRAFLGVRRECLCAPMSNTRNSQPLNAAAKLPQVTHVLRCFRHLLPCVPQRLQAFQSICSQAGFLQRNGGERFKPKR
jgi:hypothetical protein